MNSTLVSEIERLQSLLRSIGFVAVDCLRPGLTKQRIESVIEQVCPQLADEELHDDFLTWFGWQNGLDFEKHQKLRTNQWDFFAPGSNRFSSLEEVLETLNIYLQVDDNAHRDNFLLFSDLSGSMYGICPTRTGWRMHYWDRDEGGPEPILPILDPIPSDPDILAEAAPTLAEWLHTLSDRIENQEVILDDEGSLRHFNEDAWGGYPWTH